MKIAGYGLTNLLFIICGLIIGSVAYGETIPSIMITNYQTDLAYLISWNGQRQVANNYENACLAFSELYWGVIPSKSSGEACYSPTRNSMVLGAITWYCSDGTLAYDNIPWWVCNQIYTCPNYSWTLTSDKKNCVRETPACGETQDTVSEFQLLAAIVYGEASVNSPFEEKAAIANAVINRRNILGYATVQDLINEFPDYSAAVANENERYKIALCANIQVDYPELYNAITNAFDPQGTDYSNGGCFWDGKDLKSNGTKHIHYRWGYTFTNPTHNVLSVTPPLPKNKKDVFGTWNYTLESTAGYGKTIFWKYNSNYITARRAKQCK